VKGTGLENGFALRQADGSYLDNTDAKKIKWESKFYDDFIIYVAVKLDDGSIKYLSYRPRFSESHDDVLAFKLPDSSESGVWNTFTRDLEVDLHQYLPQRSIASVVDFQVRGTGCLDDIVLMAEGSDAGTTDESTNNTNDVSPDGVDTQTPATDDGDFSLTIDADFSVNVSSSVTVTGSGTNLDQNQLAAQLSQDLQNNLNLLLPTLSSTTQTSGDYATSLATLDRLMAMSEMILSTTAVMATDPDLNEVYLNAMLRLSGDIKEMADRILLQAQQLESQGVAQVIVDRMFSEASTIQANVVQAQLSMNEFLSAIKNVRDTATNTDIADKFQQFEAQLSNIITMLIQMQPQGGGDSNSTDANTTDFNNQLASTLALLTQMQSMMNNPSNGISLDMNQMMTQFQESMAPLMSIIPQMFAMADKGMDMMDPEKYIPEMMQMAQNVMDFSKYMVDTAADLMKDPNVDHELYVNAMLRLSDDIGLMADRILVMADKMLEMGDKMQVVAEKMLDMMGGTQTNLLIAQENFNNLLLGLAGRQ